MHSTRARAARFAFSIGLALAIIAGAPAAAQDRPELSRSDPPGAIPADWEQAPVVALWPGDPPSRGYRPREAPADIPASFLQAIERPTMRVFRPAAPNGAAVLVMPGGAYDFVSINNEGVAVARALAERGYTAFVLVYRLPGEGWRDRADVPLQDAQRAIRLIRRDAERYGVDHERVAVLGFSAGGHLAATLATDYAQEVYQPRDAADRLSARPDAVGLIYPVIAIEAPYTHRMSADRLLGEAPTPEDVVRRSPARRITAATPPAFLLHSLDDEAVPPENSLLMLEAMRRLQRPVEAHFTEEGGHGFGLGAPEASAGHWFGLFDLWLRRSFGFPASGS